MIDEIMQAVKEVTFPFSAALLVIFSVVVSFIGALSLAEKRSRVTGVVELFLGIIGCYLSAIMFYMVK